MTREEPEEVELVRGEVHGSPGHGDRALLEIDHELAELEHGLGRRADPSQHRAQPREQLSDRERLGDVVVRAGVERGDLLAPPRPPRRRR